MGAGLTHSAQPFFLPYSPECVEQEFSEVRNEKEALLFALIHQRRGTGILRSSHRALVGGIMLIGGKGDPSVLCAGRKRRR